MRSPEVPETHEADHIIAVWPHDDRPADLVRELKYGRATTVITELADAMAGIAPTADLVTWVPASPQRRRQRGFDQGELLARAIARRLGLPVRKALRRTDDVPQTARELAGRLQGPAFAHRGRRLRFSPRVLLIDDVCTTGSTVRAATDVLRARGAAQVIGLVATRAVRPARPAPTQMGVYHLATSQPSGG